MKKTRHSVVSKLQFHKTPNTGVCLGWYFLLLIIGSIPTTVSSTAFSHQEATEPSSNAAPAGESAPRDGSSARAVQSLAADPPPSGGSQPPGTLDPPEDSGLANIGASVDPSTGAARATVPFALPRARGMAQPALGLAYSSTASTGEVGHQWSMGLPRVERRNPSNGPRYRDPNPGEPIDPNVEDAFELSGMRLVPICLVRAGTCANGAKLPLGEELPRGARPGDGWMYYRPQYESSFSRIFWSPDHRTWLVQTRQGTVIQLGVPLDAPGDESGLDRDTGESPTDPPIFRWNIVRQADDDWTKNVIVYDWQKFPAPPGPDGRTDGLGYLTDVYDTLEATRNEIVRSAFAHHVHLTYSHKMVTAYPSPVVWRRKRVWLLDHVDVSSRDFSSTSPRHLVRRYELDYARPFEPRNYLSQVLVRPACDVREDNEQKFPTDIRDTCGIDVRIVAEFSYIDDKAKTDSKPFKSGVLDVPHTPEDRVTFVDVDGNGRADIVKAVPYATFAKVGRMGVPFVFTGLTFEGPPRGVIGSPDMLLKQPILGDWLKDGRLNAIGLDFDQGPDTPRYAMFTPAPSIYGWSFTAGPTKRLQQWAGGPSQVDPKCDPKVIEHFVDIDADGYLDRVLIRASKLPSPACTETGYEQIAFVTTVSADGATVSPFSRIIRNELKEPEMLHDLNDPYKLFEEEVFDGNFDGIPDLFRTYRKYNIDTKPYDSDKTQYEYRCQWIGNGRGSFVDPHCVNQEVEPPKVYWNHDVNGDTVPDRIELLPGRMVVELRAEKGTFYSATFPANSTDVASVQFADIDGSGIDSILVVPKHSQTIDYYTFPTVSSSTYGDVRPGLLVEVSNRQIGWKSTIGYKISEGTEGLPAAIHSVSEIRTQTLMPYQQGITGGPYVTRYAYREPVYDPVERRFRGYRFVTETREDESNPSNLLATEMRFFLGDCADLGIQPVFCNAESQARNPFRAIIGRPTLVERRDGHGSQYRSTTHYSYQIAEIYHGMDSNTVTMGYPQRVDTWRYDVDKGNKHSKKVEVQDADVFGWNPVKRTITLAGDSAMAIAHIATETSLNVFGHVGLKYDHGTVEAGPGIEKDSPIEQRIDWALPQGDSSRWLWRPSDVFVGAPGESHRHSHFEYDSSGRLTKSFGDLKGTLLLDRFHEDPSAEVAGPPSDASHDGDNLLRSEISYDAWGNVARVQGTNGRCTEYAYDAAFRQLPVATTVHTNGCGGPGLTTTTAFHRGLELPTTATTPSGMVSVMEYDGYGRPVRQFEPNPQIPSMPQSEPSLKLTYVDDWYGYRRVEIERRVDDGRSTAKYDKFWSYIDPYGHNIGTLAPSDPGDPAPYVLSAQSRLDGFGRVIAQYEPRFVSTAPDMQYPQLPADTVAARRVAYDSLGRVERTFGLDGTPTSAYVYHPLSEETLDAADLVQGATAHPVTTVRDGHGRTRFIRRTTDQGGVADTLTTEMIYLPTGEVSSVKRSHSAGGDVYIRNLQYDSFGRLVQNAEPNTSTDFGGAGMKAWRYAYNDAGDLVGTSDARGCGRNSQFDGAGRLVAQTYSPCLKTHATYADRPAARWIYDAPENGQIGPDGQGAAASYAGRLAAVYDRAEHVQYVYDGRGRTTRVRKQIAVPNEAHDPVIAYAEPWFEKAFRFDDPDRVIAESTGASIDDLLGQSVTVGSLTGRSVVTTAYSTRGLPVRIGGSYGDLVTSTVADADGQILSQAFADVAGTSVTYGYNGKRLLNQARIARPSKAPTVLQDVRIDSYDPVNNPLLVGDARIVDEWPDGAKPVTRAMTYDDLYQLRRVDYAFPTASGDDKQVSVFEAEAKAKDPTPVPEQAIQNRVKWQAFDYDWQGNLRATDDDAHAFFDRSMGGAAYGSATHGPNQIVSAALGEGRVDAIHDAAGNLSRMLVKKKDAHGANVSLLFVYEWDEVGRLVRARRLSSAEIPQMDALGTQVLQMDLSRIDRAQADLAYTYDAGGQRVIKAHKNPLNQARRYSIEVFGTLRLNHAEYDGEEYGRTDETEVPYLVSNGAALGRVVHNVDLPKGADGKTQHVFLTMTDPLGSTSVVIDKATGELVERATYLAYGQAESDYRPERWESFREDYRFTGKEDDVGVGLTYFGARYYVAALGRWASADPLTIHGLGSDLNPYAFVLGSPQRYVDPTGLLAASDPCPDCWVAGGGFDGGFDAFVGGMGAGGPTGWGMPASARDPFHIMTGGQPANSRYYTSGSGPYVGQPLTAGVAFIVNEKHRMSVTCSEAPCPARPEEEPGTVRAQSTWVKWEVFKVYVCGMGAGGGLCRTVVSGARGFYAYLNGPGVSDRQRTERIYDLMTQNVSPVPIVGGGGAGAAMEVAGGGRAIAAAVAEEGLEIPGLMMGAGEGPKGEGRSRDDKKFASGRDAQEQLEDIENAQAQNRARGQSDRIYSKQKSTQRLDNDLRRLKSQHDADEEFGDD